jgi:hypothetical protein
LHNFPHHLQRWYERLVTGWGKLKRQFLQQRSCHLPQITESVGYHVQIVAVFPRKEGLHRFDLCLKVRLGIFFQ